LKNLLQIGFDLSFNVLRGLSGRRFIVMGKRNCFAPVTFACSGGAASVRPFSAFDGDDPGRTCCFPFEKARIRAASREKSFIFSVTHDASLFYVFAPAFRVFVTFL